jgi:hypothetical protein
VQVLGLRFQTTTEADLLEAAVSLVLTVKFMNFILGRAGDLYLCLYNQLFALLHYVFKFLTP